MARGAFPPLLDPVATPAAPETLPPFFPLPPTASSSTSSTTPTVPSYSPLPSEYHYQSTPDVESTERERRYKAETELAVTKTKLAHALAKLEATEVELAVTKAEFANAQAKREEAEEALKEIRDKHWTKHMIDAAQEMGPGGALIATVGAPLLAAPLAVATVVKGFQSVGNGIGSLFASKATRENNGPNPATPQPNAQQSNVSTEYFSFYTEQQQ